MTPEIVYLMPGRVSAGPLGPQELLRRCTILQQWAGETAHVEVWDLPEGPLSIESEQDEAACLDPLLRRVPEVEAQGADALIIGCFGDPGLELARARADLPVIGPAQASMFQAAVLAERFSVLTVVDGVVGMIRRLARHNSLEGRLASIRVVQTPVLKIAASSEATFERLAAEGRAAVRDDRAGALILGCMSMAFQSGYAARLQQTLGVPVINPAQTALAAAVTVCHLGRPARRLKEVL